jgi:hypothetical protein
MPAGDKDLPKTVSDVAGFAEDTLHRLRLLRDKCPDYELNEAIRKLEEWQAKYAGGNGRTDA